MPFGSLAGAAGLVGADLRKPSGRLCRGVDAARRRDGGLALRSGLRDARAHLRRARAPADHGADARRRLCLDGELARRPTRCSSRSAGRARTWSTPRCSLSSPRRCMPSRCRARAPTPMSCPPTARRPPPPVRPASGAAFLLLVAAFSAYAFIPSGLSAHLLAILQRAGIDAGTVVFIGTLFGPSQVAARLCEFIFARNIHPLIDRALRRQPLVLAFALLWLFGISTPVAIDVRDHVRRRQWADHHRARRGAARTVRAASATAASSAASRGRR